MPEHMSGSGTPLPHTSEERDLLLMKRLCANDTSALDELLRLYWQPLVDFSERMLGSRDAAEDIGQQAFLRLWEGRMTWKIGGSVRAYLYRVARNLALNERKRQRVRLRWLEILGGEESHGPATPEQIAAEDQLERDIHDALAALPARRREVFELVRFHQLSYKQVGAIMGISAQTVANQFSAALSGLRRALADHLGEHDRPAAQPSHEPDRTGSTL